MTAFRSMRYPVDEGCRAGATKPSLEKVVPCSRPWEDYYEGLRRADKRPTRTYTGALVDRVTGFFPLRFWSCLPTGRYVRPRDVTPASDSPLSARCTRQTEGRRAGDPAVSKPSAL